MLSLIDSVAAIIEVRLRADLEGTLAIVIHEFVGAASVTLWRAVERNGAQHFQERVFVYAKAGPSVVTSDSIAAAPTPLEEMHPEARAAFSEGRYVRGVHDDGELGRHLFPIMDSGQVVGLIEIVRAPPLGEEHERSILGLIRIYRSHLGLLESSDTDELTGLSNRRPFDDTFSRLADGKTLPSRKTPTRRIVDGNPSTAELAILDIDFFKRINDTYGHPYGDEVLVRLAQLMRQSFRDTDRFFRFGGEEFVVILPETLPDDAETALNRFRSSISNFDFPRVGRVTISLGVTSIRAGETGSDAFGRADEALYVSKQLGRNQLRRYETLIAEGLLSPKRPLAQHIELF